MKSWQRNLIRLVSLLIVFWSVGFALPSTAHVERDIIINAPPAEVYELISDFKQWGQWSPWARLDPEVELAISGSGLGQTMMWASDNPQVGSGQQEIIELERDRQLKTHIEFDGQGVANATFELTAALNETDGVVTKGTKVVWSLDSTVNDKAPFFFKPINNYFGLLLDSLVGKDYETGLANIKQIAEN
ncbi:MAG: SRPBCC family protein [Cyanobacteria bacterium P01_F01_bin.150]